MKPFFKQNRAQAQIKSAPSAHLFVATTLLLAALVYTLWPSADSDASGGAGVPRQGSGWQQSGAANPFGQGKAVAETASKELLSTAEPLSLASTSLAGTQPDGDWGQVVQGRLVPQRALRQRFDYYLSLIGELPLADLRAMALQDAQKTLQPPALDQAMALWDRYVQLQQHAWKHAVDLRQPGTWSVALSERQIMRRHLLGADVAHAFYADEESALQSMIARVNAGATAAAAQEPVQTNTVVQHPQAQEREAQLQAQWQAWEGRVDAARRQVLALRQAPELSALQRRDAIESYMSQHFSGTELIRARGLLGL